MAVPSTTTGTGPAEAAGADGAPVDGALAWFADLAEDNSREFWAATRERYRREVLAPFQELLAAAGGDWRVYRPHEDTRYRPGGPPLKTFLGAVSEAPDGTGRFVRIDAQGLMAACGMPWFAPDQLRRWRAALDDEAAGVECTGAVDAVRATGLHVEGGRPEPLRRTPRGFSAGHPRADLLRWKGVEAVGTLGREAWTDAEGRAGAVRGVWRRAAPVVDWAAAAVGPSTLPRPGR